jgi:uncharacterized protein YqjF (DUF2071 family)
VQRDANKTPNPLRQSGNVESCVREVEPISVHAPHRVPRPVMFQGWKSITFLHWPYPAGVIARLLPPALTPDTFDGSAWVGLTPFLVTSLRPPCLPPLPWISRFPEMNVRTYVIGPKGQRGIWFFSLEAARLPAVVAARITYGLPYRWARMHISESPGLIEYSSHRTFGKGSAEITIETGRMVKPDEQDRFLTARFRLYSQMRGRLASAPVEHAPWPLYAGKVSSLQQDVIAHSGLPAPQTEPLVRWSTGVYTQIGRLKRVE